MFQDFRYSDTVRLSRSDEVLKLKNFKKDAALKLFKVDKSRKECKDISSERRALINKLLNNEGWKDYKVKSTLWKYVSEIQDNISHKIR
ncbi:hypothetical protein Tco_0721555 [Tanacetum coccineum]